MKKIMLILLLLLIALSAVLAYRTLTFSSKQISVAPVQPEAVNPQARFNLARAIRIKTISPEDPAAFDSSAFRQFNLFLKETYPLTHQKLELKTVNEFSLLFKWQGSDTSLKPVIFTAHTDVVPVAEETLEEWVAAPFDGEIKDNIIYGRGAIDDKISVIGLLEATEALLQQNFRPKQTIYLAFGHDEEIGGKFGAQALVKQLQAEKVEAEFVLDEGYAITQNLVPGLDTDVALIGISEKGFVSIELTTHIEGGHSSMPKPETAIDIISKAVVSLRRKPFKARITPPVQEFINHLGPEMPAFQKFAFANAWLLKPLILKTYQKTASGNALVNNTMAPTMLSSGLKENVIPAEARAVLNFRLLPGTTIRELMKEVKENINDDRVKITLKEFASEASPISSTTSAGYATLNKTIKQVYPNTLTSPSMVLAATDGRFYHAISPNVYRFLPIKLHKDNINTFHGVNERIPVPEFEDAIRFYMQLIRNLASQEENKSKI